MRHGRYPFIVGFLAAPVLLYVVLVIKPYGETFYISLTRWSGLSAPVWVGFDNFERLFRDDTFWKAVRHHGVLLVALPLFTIAIALFFAFMLNVAGGRARNGQAAGVWGSKFYRVVYFFPQVL
ncbi:MAG TPA: sugar ABC transporter permease, partial [Micromonosporaceae bacterium]|nr:sugar ABC transporter permease [Micromonosporaceae bacterium]